MRVTRYQCTVCGKLTAGRQPYGEATIIYPRKHGYIDGVGYCPGSFLEARIVEVEREPDQKHWNTHIRLHANARGQ